jgi:hypothetical protein
VIFPKDVAELIAKGKKTQARRRVKAGAAGSIKDSPYQPGHDYTIQWRDRQPDGDRLVTTTRVIVTELRREPITQITLAEARLEGHADITEFARCWLGPRAQTWDTRKVLDRFHALQQIVWVISFRRGAADTPILLHKYSEYGYTTLPGKAMRGEGEPVDPEIEKYYAHQAAENYRKQPRDWGRDVAKTRRAVEHRRQRKDAA